MRPLRGIATVSLALVLLAALSGPMAVSGTAARQSLSAGHDGGASAGFQAASGGLTMRLAEAGAEDGSVLGGGRFRDVNLEYSFSMDQLPTGEGAAVMALVRRSAAGAYRGRVLITSDGRMSLSFQKEDARGRTRSIGPSFPVRQWRYQAGQVVHIRVQAVSHDATQLRMKVWRFRQPNRWQLVRNDGRADIGTPGTVSLRAALGKSATAVPLNVQVDDLKVGRALNTRKVRGTTARQSSPATKAPTRKPPADADAPRLLEIDAVDIGTAEARIRWSLDEVATGVVRYGRSVRLRSADQGRDDIQVLHACPAHRRTGSRRPSTTTPSCRGTGQATRSSPKIGRS